MKVAGRLPGFRIPVNGKAAPRLIANFEEWERVHGEETGSGVAGQSELRRSHGLRKKPEQLRRRQFRLREPKRGRGHVQDLPNEHLERAPERRVPPRRRPAAALSTFPLPELRQESPYGYRTAGFWGLPFGLMFDADSRAPPLEQQHVAPAAR